MKRSLWQLQKFFHRIHDKFALKLEVKRDAESLKAFMTDILPNYDPDKVYVSDMKKVVSWYQVLAEFLPEMLERKEEEVEVKEEGEKEEEKIEK